MIQKKVSHSIKPHKIGFVYTDEMCNFQHNAITHLMILYSPNHIAMTIKRSEFIKQSLLMSAGTAFFAGTSLATLTGCTSSDDTSDSTLASSSRPFGIQLWSVRDVIGDDVQGTLQKLSDYGYRQIETFDGEMGMFWGMGHEGYKTFLNDLNMTPISGHCNFMENAEEKIEQAAAIGMEYLIVPWLGAQETMDDYRRAAAQFNVWGEMCKQAGIQFAYHNHDYSFVPVGGVYPQDVMMEETDPELVQYEMDVFWVAVAGEDPADWMKRYPGRFTLAHIKDLASPTAASTSESEASTSAPQSTVLGTGTLDLATMIYTAKEYGCKHMIVEQEQYEGTDPMSAAADNATWMQKQLG